MPESEVPAAQIECAAILKRCSTAEEMNEQTFSLPAHAEMVIGREADCQIVIDAAQHPAVSRRHAKVQPVANSPQQWQICDLNSANGTYINGVRLQNCQTLQTGDRITLSCDGPEFLFERQEGMLSAPTPTRPTHFGSESAAIRSLWDLAAHRIIHRFVGHAAAVRAIAFSLDGTVLASGSADGTAKLWSLETGTEIQSLPAQPSAIHAVALSSVSAHLPASSGHLASGGADKIIRLWNLSTIEAQELIGHSRAITAIAFSSNSKLLASGSEDKTIRLWDVTTGAAVATLAGHKMWVSAIALSPDSQLLASGSADRTVKLWQVGSDEEAVTLATFKAAINALMFSPDGEILAIASDDQTIRLWNLKTRQEIRSLSGQGQAGAVALSADGQAIAHANDDFSITVRSI